MSPLGPLLIIAGAVVVVVLFSEAAFFSYRRNLPTSSLRIVLKISFLPVALLVEFAAMVLSACAASVGLSPIVVPLLFPIVMPIFDHMINPHWQPWLIAGGLLGAYLSAFLVFFTNAVVISAFIEKTQGREGSFSSSVRAVAAIAPGIALLTFLATTILLALAAVAAKIQSKWGGSWALRWLEGVLGISMVVLQFGLWLAVSAAITLMLTEGLGAVDALRRLAELRREGDTGLLLRFVALESSGDADTVGVAGVLGCLTLFGGVSLGIYGNWLGATVVGVPAFGIVFGASFVVPVLYIVAVFLLDQIVEGMFASGLVLYHTRPDALAPDERAYFEDRLRNSSAAA